MQQVSAQNQITLPRIKPLRKGDFSLCFVMSAYPPLPPSPPFDDDQRVGRGDVEPGQHGIAMRVGAVTVVRCSDLLEHFGPLRRSHDVAATHQSGYQPHKWSSCVGPGVPGEAIR